MRRRDVIAVLTLEEKQSLIRNSFRLLCDLQAFEAVEDSPKALVTQLKRLLEQLFKDEPEECLNKIAGGYRSAHDPGFVEYCVPYKKVETILYFADGRLSNGLTDAILSPWEPSYRTKVELQKKNEAYKLDHQKRQTGEAVEEKAKADIVQKDKQFWNSMLRHRNLFLKFQLCKLLKKKFTVPKRFNTAKQPIWQLAEAIKGNVLNLQQQQQVAKVIAKIENDCLVGLFHVSTFCTRLSFLAFETLADVKEAYRQRELTYTERTGPNNWYETKRFWKEIFVDVRSELGVPTRDLDYGIAKFLYIVFSLQDYANKPGNEEFREFLALLGIAKQKEKGDIS